MSNQKNWPTPTAMTGGGKVAPSHLAGKHGWNIAAAVSVEANWPTPATRDHHAQGANHNTKAQSSSLATIAEKKNWPTPAATETDAVGPRPSRIKTNRKTEYLSRTVNTHTSKLSPNWVEQLMGLPVGWSQLPREWTDDLS